MLNQFPGHHTSPATHFTNCTLIYATIRVHQTPCTHHANTSPKSQISRGLVSVDRFLRSTTDDNDDLLPWVRPPVTLQYCKHIAQSKFMDCRAHNMHYERPHTKTNTASVIVMQCTLISTDEAK
mmetsp:Transcript_105967/g.182740  ORF Transcript_105967/g.182740 Transcript_105967/m.182740 type:complete len:124 (-) Transcript_105967:1276-1647(-)